MFKITKMVAAVFSLTLTLAAAAQAVDIEMVLVEYEGNGNKATGRSDRNHGAVDYVYQIGKHEVTNGQYCEFLNAVAGTDPNSLYNTNMNDVIQGGITQIGNDGSYQYNVKTGTGWTMGDKPVNYVSIYDMLRFCNWLHNGQPTGEQADSTTEDGAYDISAGLLQKEGAKYWIPTADEFVKASKYDPRPAGEGGPGDDGYWEYATMSNGVPTQVEAAANGDGKSGSTTPVTAGNYANYGKGTIAGGVTWPNWNGTTEGNVTTVGTNGGPSFFGTSDQDGNVMEPRAMGNGTFQQARGYYAGGDGGELQEWYGTNPTSETPSTGFRIAASFFPGLTWDGGVGFWADSMWNGGAAPTADQDMIINADTDDSVVTVAADFISGGTGPAASVFAGEEYAGKLVVAGGNTLEVTGETTAGEFGKIAIENGATLQTGSAVIEIDGRLIASVQGSTSGLLDSAGQLTIDDADAIQVDWMPGIDATSMFGGTYTVAQYTGTALATVGTTANADANIGPNYVKSVAYDVDVNGDGTLWAIDVELHDQGLGDTDLDADVDGDDLATFGLAWAPSGIDKTWFDGDFDFDGDIDGDDLAALGLAWAPSGIDFPAGELKVTAIPEPGTIAMLLIGAGMLIYRKRRGTLDN